MRQALQTIGTLVIAIAAVWTTFSPIPEFMETMRDFAKTQRATQADLATLIEAQTTALRELAETQRAAQAELVSLADLSKSQTTTLSELLALLKAQDRQVKTAVAGVGLKEAIDAKLKARKGGVRVGFDTVQQLSSPSTAPVLHPGAPDENVLLHPKGQ